MSRTTGPAPASRTALRVCPLCEATCGLVLTIEGARVTGARGDRDDVFSKGFICPKGAAFGAADSDPDRLSVPLVRRDGELREATWEEAPHGRRGARRRLYRLTVRGQRALGEGRADWQRFVHVLGSILGAPA